jgi:hypothetical protein
MFGLLIFSTNPSVACKGFRTDAITFYITIIVIVVVDVVSPTCPPLQDQRPNINYAAGDYLCCNRSANCDWTMSVDVTVDRLNSAVNDVTAETIPVRYRCTNKFPHWCIGARNITLEGSYSD